MQKLYFLFFMRPLQAIGLLFFVGGLVKAVPVASSVAQALVGQLDWPTTCQKVATVAAQIWGGGLWAWLMQYFISGERHLRLGLQNHPDEPWLINPMWATQHIRLSNRPALIGFSIAAAIYLTVAVPYAISTQSTNVYWTVGAAGLVLLLFIRGAWLKRKWNRAELRLGNVPGVIGGPFTGVVMLQEQFPPDTTFEISLKCLQASEEEEGAVHSVNKTDGTTIWSSVLYIAKTLPMDNPSVTAIPVSFAIPHDCSATTLKPASGTRKVWWKLFVTLKNQPRFGECAFEVPVFKTPESRRDFRLPEELIAPYYESIAPEAVLRRANLRRTPLADGSERWEFSMFNLTNAFFALGLSIASAVGLWAALSWIRPLPLALFVGFFPLLILVIGIYVEAEILLWQSSIVRKADRLEIEAGFWGLRRRAIVARDATTCLECELDFRKGHGEWWYIFLRPQPLATSSIEPREQPRDLRPSALPARIILVKRLDGRVEAKAVQDWLAEQLGVSSNTT